MTNDPCPKCGCTATETVITGHCNNHGESDFQETTVSYYCAECGEFIRSETFVSEE